MEEHHKNARESNRARHEEGQAQKKAEKKTTSGRYKPQQRKRNRPPR
jgi:hypothetical protein